MDDLHRALSASTPRKPRSTTAVRGLDADVLQQRVGLLQLLGQRVAVVGVAGEGPRAHHQALLVRDGQADLHAELVGLARLALADALHLGRVQRVELVLVVALLGADALGALQPHRQLS